MSVLFLLVSLALAAPIGRPTVLPYDRTAPMVDAAAIPDAEPEAPRIVVDPAAVAGVETVVSVLDAFGDPAVGRTVQVFHRPRLDGERQMAIGITDSRGRVRWTPELAGVARVQAGDDTLPVVVGGPIPAGTVTLLAVLIAIAAAGAAFSLRDGTPRRRAT